MEDKADTLKSLAAAVLRLHATVEELAGRLCIVEAEAVAVGNILLRKGLVSMAELDAFTDASLKEIRKGVAEEERRRAFEEMMQKKVVQ